MLKLQKVKTETTINNYIDQEHGEVLGRDVETKHHNIVVSDKQAFFWAYNSIIALIDNLSKTEMKLLYYACLNAQWDKNVIGFGKPICEDITKEIGIGYQTIKNTIATLKKKKILIPMSSGYYRINPRYYWKGNSSERLKVMKYVLEIECPNC